MLRLALRAGLLCSTMLEPLKKAVFCYFLNNCLQVTLQVVMILYLQGKF